MLIFVSWGGDTSLPIARVLHDLLQTRFRNEEVFLSDRSIEPGDDPSRRVLEDGLLRAEVLVAVLTKDDVGRPWVIWETASVGRDKSSSFLFSLTFNRAMSLARSRRRRRARRCLTKAKSTGSSLSSRAI